MADFQYSAELELNTSGFIQGLAQVDKTLKGLENSANVPSEALDRLRTRFLNLNKAGEFYGRVVQRVGKDSDLARRQMSALASAAEQLQRDLNKVKGAGTLSGTPNTNLEKDQAKIAADWSKAQQRMAADAQKTAKVLQNDAWATYSDNIKRGTAATMGAKKAQDEAYESYSRNLNATKNRVNEEKRALQQQNEAYATYAQNIRVSSNEALRAREAQNKAFESYSSNINRTALLENERKAQMALVDAQDQYVDSLGNTRYALYDVANTMSVVAVATLGLVTAGTALSASYERAFADVERTSGAAGEQLGQLQDDLIALTTQMPTSFGDITDIATLGGQLGIASDNIAEFTRVVSQFSATTDVTVTAAAEGLGRLAQLSKTPQEEMVNLASSIYEVGINSVATESAILGVAQQIAVSGSLAGFAAEETVALSGALASLGVAPEAARGSIMRIFNEIRTAVDAGGDSLELFASTAGMTATEFQNIWRTDPQAGFVALLEGMEGAADRGENLTGILQDMGIWAVRDQRAIQLLADNMGVYEQAIADSTSAYAEGTSLQEGFAVVAETVSARTQVLLETLKSLVAEGFGPMLGIVADILQPLQWLAERMLEFAQTPVGGAIFTIVSGLTATVGVLALAVAGWARLNGAMIAMLQATNQYLKQKAGLVPVEYTVNGLLKEQIGLILGLSRAQTANTAVTHSATAANTGYAASLTASAGGTSRLAASAVKFSSMLGPLTLGIAAMAALGNKYAEQMSNVRDANSLFGEGSTGLEQAIKEDTAAMREGADSFREFSVHVNSAGERIAENAKLFGTMGDATSDTNLPDWVASLEDSAGAQVNLGDETENTTNKIKEQMFALGDASKQYIADTLANDAAFQEFWRNSGDAIDKAGIDIEQLLEDSLSSDGGGSRALQGYIDDVMSQLEELGYYAKTANPFSQDADSFMTVDPGDRDAVFELLEQWTHLYQLAEQFSAVDESIGGTVSNIELKTALYNAMGVEMDALGDDAQELGEDFAGFAEGLFDSISSLASFNDALFGLHESLAENGNDFSAYTEGGIANIQALEQAVQAASDQAGTDIGQFGANLANIFAQMEGAGALAGGELDFLRVQLINTFNQQYGLDLDISNARGSIHQFIADAITALQVRAQIERRGMAVGGLRASNLPDQSRPKGSNIPDPNVQINEQIRSLETLQRQLLRAEDAGRKTGQGMKEGMDKGGKAAKKAADDAKNAADQIYTLLDYASDLSSIFDRALDLRFGNENARDDTASILQDMRDKADAAAESIRDLQQKIRELKADLGTLAADRNTLQFQLGVAVEYGDELRATEIRAELAQNSADAADKQKDLEDTQKDLTEEQDEATKSLEGNTKGARDNRKTVQDLLGSYRQQLVTLAQNGASQDELKRKSADLKREFQAQLTQMGYNRDEVDKYAQAFDDFSYIIQNVPRNITVTARANTNPATQALNEWIEANKNKTINVRTTASTPSISGNVSGGSWTPSSVAVGSGGVSTRGMAVGGTITGRDLTATRQISSPYINVTRGMAGGTRLASGGEVGYHATGGIHGLHPGQPKGTDTTPAWLTPGEYVQRKKAVDHYGLPFMNAINSLKLPKYYASGGGVQKVAATGSNGIQLVEILPHQFRELVNATANQVVKLNNATIAQATNKTNARSAQRGSN